MIAMTGAGLQESSPPKLLRDLGFVAPGPDEEARALGSEVPVTPSEPRATPEDLRVPAAVLSGDPLISYSGMIPGACLGVASILDNRLRARPAWFLLSPAWSIESEQLAGEIRARAIRHRRLNPTHRFIFVCNTPEEATLMQSHHEAAFFYNKTANTLETIFRPLPDTPDVFDAVYNAQLSLWKRHELSAEVRRCAFLCYVDCSAPNWDAMRESILRRHARIPGHVFINAFDKANLPIRLAPSEVNRELNRARVGLCLSSVEGAMFASAEYLLAGLPIVTTPSKGGRHVYHDPEYCWTVPADPRSVAEAVHALGAKEIPRAYIRERTLRRLARDRERFLGLIDGILEEVGSQRRLERPWPFRKAVTMEWLAATDAVDRAAFPLVDGFGRPEKGLVPWRLRRKLLALQRRRAGG